MRQGQASGDSVQVGGQAIGETGDAGQCRLLCPGDPFAEPVAVQAGQHQGERTHQASSGSQLRASFEYGSKPIGVTLHEMIGVPADPAGNLPDRRRLGDLAQVGAGAVLLDEGADDAVLAGEALRGDLALQGDSPSVIRRTRCGLNGSRLLGRGFCPTTISCQVAARAYRDTVLWLQPRRRAICRIPAPWSSRSCTSMWCSRRRCAIAPPGSGTVAASGSSLTGTTAHSSRQPLYRATQRSTALARFCHRWNRSATCTASGAPVRAPSNGEISYWKCWNACRRRVICQMSPGVLVAAKCATASSTCPRKSRGSGAAGSNPLSVEASCERCTAKEEGQHRDLPRVTSPR
jgi:hypothetical protein